MKSAYELLTGATDLWGRYPVAFAYLFGSEAQGKSRPNSDIDVAVYVADGQDRSSYLDLQLRLIADLGDLMQTDQIDVVILNEAPVALSYRVTRDGRIVFCKDEAARIHHWAEVVDRYIDMEPMRRTLA